MPNTNAYIVSNIRNLKDNIIYTVEKIVRQTKSILSLFHCVCGIEPHTNAYLAGYEPDWSSLDYHTMS